MWTCPVCQNNCTENFCQTCGFDHSADFEQFPTLQPLPAGSRAISVLRQQRQAQQQVQQQVIPPVQHSVHHCPSCNTPLSSHICHYCGFDMSKFPTLEVALQTGANHRHAIFNALTNFAITTYQYVWAPARSRLERQCMKVIPFGNAQHFYNNIHWLPETFAQVHGNNNTALDLNISYLYRNVKKTLYCKIPTVHGNNFWQLGISIDNSLHVTFHLRSGDQMISSAPMPLNLT